MALETRQKGHLSHMAESLAALSCDKGKVENVPKELGDLCEISRQSVEGASWFLLLAYIYTQEERCGQGRAVKQKKPVPEGFSHS